MTDNARWEVSMRGCLGYTCSVFVSCANARDAAQAMNIAGMMFPELRPIDASKVEPRADLTELRDQH